MQPLAIKHKPIQLRKVLVWIAAAFAVVFVIVSITEIENIIAAMRKGNWLFVLLALLLQVICLLNNAYTYRTLYRLVGLEATWRNLFLLSTASTFINLIAPSGGIGGMAVFIDSAKQRNISSAKVIVIGILYAIYEYISLLCVVALGFVALIRRHDLTTSEIIAAFVLLVITIVFTLILYIGYRSTAQLGNLMFSLSTWINRLVYRFFHRDVINAENAHTLAAEIGEGVNALRGKNRHLLKPLLFALSNKALLIGVLTAIFLSLRVPFSLGTIVAGYGMAQLFFYVTPTPAGVGFVEGIFPLTLKALNVPFSKALLITLIYRGITLWFAFGVGFFSFRKLQRKNAKLKTPS